MADANQLMTLPCDCGFVARGETKEELTTAAQAHAAHEHGMDLDAALILRLAHLTDRPDPVVLAEIPPSAATPYSRGRRKGRDAARNQEKR